MEECPFEKLIVADVVKKFFALFWNTKVHYCFHRKPPLDPNLSKFNPVYIPTPYFLNIYFKIRLASSLRLHLQTVSSLQIDFALLINPVRATFPTHLILLDLITLFGIENRL
jgi:hypothetical protein